MDEHHQAATGIDLSPSRHFEMTTRLPEAGLAGLITAIAGYRETAAGNFRQTEAASLNIPLVISFGEPFTIGLGRRPGEDDKFGSFAAGLFAGPVVIESFGASNCVQVNFTPLGARRFFGVPMKELAGRMVDLESVLGAEGTKLRERLADEPDWDNRLIMVERFVTARLASAKEPRPEMQWAYDSLSSTGGRAKIGSIATAIGWSRKHLVERFAHDVGLGPKTVARILRFNRALAAGTQDNKGGWADIAAGCGYADQAHMVREFREFAGAPPTAFKSSGASG